MDTLRLRGGLCFAAALSIVAPHASAQLIVGGAPGGQIWNINPASPASPTLLASGEGTDTWGMTYDPATNTLYWVQTGNATYWLYKTVFSPSGLSSSPVGSAIVPAGGSFTGLAFDTSTGRLYSTFWDDAERTSIYELSTTTAQASFVATLPVGRYFAGFEYDAARDRFLGVSGSHSGFDGLFIINFRAGPPSYTQIALYPVAETRVDALAIGNDRAYLVNADGPIYVFNLLTGVYGPHINSPLTGSNFDQAGAAFISGFCYANCDGSTTPPVLNVSDFSCFLNAFAAGNAYANCDGSTTPPVLNIADFSCFLNRFSAGCN